MMTRRADCNAALFSVLLYGGGTFRTDTLAAADLSGGFMVSSAGHQMTHPKDSPDLERWFEHAVMQVQEAIAAASDRVDPSRWYVGAWVNEEDGLVYVDASEHIRGLERAVTTGRARGQLAIYSLTRGVSLSLARAS